MRLIDAEKLIHELSKSKVLMIVDDESNYNYIRQSDVFKIVNSIPPISATEERKKGKWREIQRYSPTDKAAINECSLCHDTVWMYDVRRWNYCPHCGAEMKGENINDDQ